LFCGVCTERFGEHFFFSLRMIDPIDGFVNLGCGREASRGRISLLPPK
jgi:hypothetical protein